MIFLLALQNMLSSDTTVRRDERGLSTASVWGCFSTTSWAMC
jgi:hypothetical protein